MTDRADETLVRACQQGDPASWEELTRRFRDLVGRVVRRVAQRQGVRAGEADVDEMVSGVFSSLVEDGYRRLKRYDPRFPLAGFLRLIARGHVLDVLRARRRRRQAEASAPVPASDARDSELRERLDGMLAGLGARERAVVRLYFFADRTCPEIARLLGIPENTVFSLLRRTLEKLRQG